MRGPEPSATERATAALLRRIADGFGVSDQEKFQRFSAEVAIACRGYGPQTIAGASDIIVRSIDRPHIGTVYAALDKAVSAAPRSAGSAPIAAPKREPSEAIKSAMRRFADCMAGRAAWPGGARPGTATEFIAALARE